MRHIGQSHSRRFPTVCSAPGCPRSFPSSRWEAIRAHDEGWFLTRNGDAWCPDHTPEWVPAWRAQQATRKGNSHPDTPKG